VKIYLNELITDAEQMRAQLFGLLQSSGISAGQIGNSEAGKAALLASLQSQHGHEGHTAGAQDSELLHKISALETRMKDQARAMELLVQEKTRIEGELTLARSKADKPQPSGAVSEGPETSKLQKKITQLEGKLAEYSVIEDDLVNLKRLQQENAELKSRLSNTSAGATAGAAAVAPAPQVEAAPVSAPTSEHPATAMASAESVAPVPATATGAPVVPQPDAQAAFADLAPQVDASLSEAPAASPSPAQPTAESAEKPKDEEPKPSEADLLAEFEKMLNG
jgi:hypothetical protein